MREKNKQNKQNKQVGKTGNGQLAKKKNNQAKAQSSKDSNQKKKVSASSKINSKKQLKDIASNSTLKATQSFYDDSVYSKKLSEKKKNKNKKNQDKNKSLDSLKGSKNSIVRSILDKTKISTKIRFNAKDPKTSNARVVKKINQNQNQNQDQDQNLNQNLNQSKNQYISQTKSESVSSDASISTVKLFLAVILMLVTAFVGYKIFSDSLNQENQSGKASIQEEIDQNQLESQTNFLEKIKDKSILNQQHSETSKKDVESNSEPKAKELKKSDLKHKLKTNLSNPGPGLKNKARSKPDSSKKSKKNQSGK